MVDSECAATSGAIIKLRVYLVWERGDAPRAGLTLKVGLGLVPWGNH